MNILKDTSLESNPYLKINFNGGDLSSDAGLLLIKEFAEKIGLIKLVYQMFKTNDTALYRFHIDPENLLQMIYQIIAAYFVDDCADELTVDPVFWQYSGKKHLHRNQPFQDFLIGWMKQHFASLIKYLVQCVMLCMQSIRRNTCFLIWILLCLILTES